MHTSSAVVHKRGGGVSEAVVGVTVMAVIVVVVGVLVVAVAVIVAVVAVTVVVAVIVVVTAVTVRGEGRGGGERVIYRECVRGGGGAHTIEKGHNREGSQSIEFCRSHSAHRFGTRRRRLVRITSRHYGRLIATVALIKRS